MLLFLSRVPIAASAWRSPASCSPAVPARCTPARAIPRAVTLPGVQALRLDVNKPDDVAAAAALASDVTLVINNAGIAQPGGFLAADSEELARRIFETNFFAMLRMSKAFAPVLKANGGGALLNVLSVASWVNGGELAAYSASKSAAWSLTNALRNELAAQKTQVLALHMAYVDTDLTRGVRCARSPARSRSSSARSTDSNRASMRCWPMNSPSRSSAG